MSLHWAFLIHTTTTVLHGHVEPLQPHTETAAELRKVRVPRGGEKEERYPLEQVTLDEDFDNGKW